MFVERDRGLSKNEDTNKKKRKKQAHIEVLVTDKFDLSFVCQKR